MNRKPDPTTTIDTDGGGDGHAILNQSTAGCSSSNKRKRRRKNNHFLSGSEGRNSKQKLEHHTLMEMGASSVEASETRRLPTRSSMKRLGFPDALEQRDRSAVEGGDEDANNISNVFFELANADEISYRVRNKKNRGDLLVFHQDMSVCEKHTGGIIWETSYLLLEYLLERNATKNESLGRTLELGAGVGFLGQCLAAEGCCKPIVMLTETAEVLVNLKANLVHSRSTFASVDICQVAACALDWTSYEQDVDSSEGALATGAFDTLLGTDVIFASHLVAPLLQTAAFLSHSRSVWYLCVQIRCAAAHKLFLDTAPDHGFEVLDATQEAFASNRCAWGKTLDCFLYRITRAPKKTGKSHKVY